MRCVGPTFCSEDLARLREDFSFTPDLDELAAGLALYGNATRLKIYALLRESQEMCVCDLAEVLGMTVSAVSQHLAKLRAVRLVKNRREAQTLYYALSDHPLNEVMKVAVEATRARDGE
jgi:ArsR family transcriptional regulator, lead/cadmium/zinc/bismuth-responsive transcriptional repressor